MIKLPEHANGPYYVWWQPHVVLHMGIEFEIVLGYESYHDQFGGRVVNFGWSWTIWVGDQRIHTCDQYFISDLVARDHAIIAVVDNGLAWLKGGELRDTHSPDWLAASLARPTAG